MPIASLMNDKLVKYFHEKFLACMFELRTKIKYLTFKNFTSMYSSYKNRMVYRDVYSACIENF